VQPTVSKVLRTPLAVTFAVLLGAPGASHAARLLSRAISSTSLAGVNGVQRLVLDRRALADLRGRDHAMVAAFPLGRRRTADLVLERFTPFAARARVDVMGSGGARAIALPDSVYFSGTIAGEEGSRVFLAAGRHRVHGFIVSDGDVYPFGPDGHGGHRTYAMRDVDPAVNPPPGDFCSNDLHPEAVAVPTAELSALVDAPPAAEIPGTIKVADVAIETDQEFRAKFKDDASALDYLASLAAAASAIYERDVGVRLRFSYIRLWGATSVDPWSGTDPADTLTELRTYWNNAANGMAAIAGPRTIVHFISGKTVKGGIAYLNALCNTSYGYGVSQVDGSFDLSRPSQIWDVLVVTHELGHNFGSPHSHCYNPPLDECYNQEAGCYSGPVVTSRGTIMSYCHLRAGGLSNVDLLFGNVVSTRIGQSVGAASCLGTVSVSTTTSTSTSTTTVTTSSTTSTTRVTTTTSTPTTSAPPTTSTSTTRPTTTSTTRPPTTSTSSSSTTSTTVAPSTSTTVPRAPSDADRDGVPDVVDACPGTPAGDLVDASGCSVCPCDGPRTGGAWKLRAEYRRCVRAVTRHRRAEGGLGTLERRASSARLRQSTCGRRAKTRCCLYANAGDSAGRCRIMSAAACDTRVAAGDAADAGAGSCAPSPCAR
jgi:Metallo-peptidase family M12